MINWACNTLYYGNFVRGCPYNTTLSPQTLVYECRTWSDIVPMKGTTGVGKTAIPTETLAPAVSKEVAMDIN